MIKSLNEVNKLPLRILYHAYFQSRMKHGIIVWLTDSHSKNFFVLKKSYLFDFQEKRTCILQE